MSNVCIPVDVFNKAKKDHLERIRAEYDALSNSTSDYFRKTVLIEKAETFYGKTDVSEQMKKDLI